ncbi:MAG TPA: hypothetical protein VEU32_05625 [Burkholderiales bacterium]|nr:hypothetical protein [Burkholderiales bacterium]
MLRRSKSTGSKSGKRAAKRVRSAPKDEPPVKETAPVQGHVIERPDGFYWEAKKGEPHGPFTTLAEAEADMISDGAGEEEVEPAEGLQEAESELGINEWIDPDTGGPAEDNVPRIEDH